MAQVQNFGDLLEAVDKLTSEEKETFLEVLQRRLIEDRRARMAREIKAARREFQAGKCQPVTVADLIKEIVP